MIRFRNVLLPTDFTPLSRHAVPFARSVAEMYGASLHLLHVMTPEVQPFPAPDIGMGVLALPPDEGQARKALDDFAAETMAGCTLSIFKEACVGSPVSEITRYACRQHIDLIVIGTHARGVVTRIFLGSVSKAVMEHAPCPVLMVPMKASEDSPG